MARVLYMECPFCLIGTFVYLVQAWYRSCMIQISTRIKPEIKEWLRNQAFKLRTSETALINELLQEGIDRREKGHTEDDEK